MKNSSFEILDHPADMGFRAWAPSREKLFETAALAVTSILVDLDDIAESIAIDVHVEAEDEDLLLYNWLSEILFLFDADGALLKRFQINEFMTSGDKCELSANAFGESFSSERHQVKTYVKAVTLHQLKILRKAEAFEAQVYLDI
jgi:SHS2 domain-containing protein